MHLSHSFRFTVIWYIVLVCYESIRSMNTFAMYCKQKASEKENNTSLKATQWFDKLLHRNVLYHLCSFHAYVSVFLTGHVSFSSTSALSKLFLSFSPCQPQPDTVIPAILFLPVAVFHIKSLSLTSSFRHPLCLLSDFL